MWCILIPLLVGLICALLGYLLGRACAKKCDDCQKLRDELEQSNRKIKKLETELAALKSTTDSETLIPFDADAAFAAFGKKVKENDLKIIEGIGPKIEEVFHDAKIKTWKQLGETSVEKCEQILNNAGDAYHLHNPETWPKQAKMAYEGKWEKLKEWQDQLDGGKA